MYVHIGKRGLRQERGGFTYKIGIHANTTARPVLTDGTEEELKPESYVFTAVEK